MVKKQFVCSFSDSFIDFLYDENNGVYFRQFDDVYDFSGSDDVIFRKVTYIDDSNRYLKILSSVDDTNTDDFVDSIDFHSFDESLKSISFIEPLVKKRYSFLIGDSEITIDMYLNERLKNFSIIFAPDSFDLEPFLSQFDFIKFDIYEKDYFSDKVLFLTLNTIVKVNN